MLAVLAAARAAVERARAGEGPTLLELKTYRYGGHFQGDPCNYRTREEEALWRQRDPLSRMRAHLLAGKLASEAKLAALEREVAREVAAAMRAMLKSGGPPPTGRWADLAALEPVREVKARHASTLLVFDAVERALDEIAAKADPARADVAASI